MVRVLVVDDEPLMLRNIKNMVEQTHKAFKIVGEAYDGEEALIKIKELSPDVVITDIKMPVMDGLKLLDEIKAREINIFTVLLSGYRDFEFARKAITLDAIEYLLKPLSADALKELLDNIYNKYEKRIVEKQTDLLIKIIKGTAGIDLNELSPFNFTYYTHLLLCAGSYCLFPSQSLIPLKTFWLECPLKDVVEKHLKDIDKYWIMDGKYENEKLIVLAWNNTFKDIVDACLNFHNELTDKQIPVTMIKGSITKDLNTLADSIRHSYITLNQRIVLGKSQFIIDNYANKDTPEFPNTLDPEHEKMLLLYIQQNQRDLYKKQLNTIICYIECYPFPQLRLERILKQIIGLFFKVYTFLPEDEMLNIDLEINKMITNSIDYSTIYQEMCCIVDRIFQLKILCKQDDTYHKNLADKVEEYIKSNYNEPITLQSIADTFAISAPYLSKIYRVYKSISPSDYIIQLRIEKAKQLLFAEFSMTIKDIAKSVGYDDPFYFSRLFKSITGSSPAHFRSRE